MSDPTTPGTMSWPPQGVGLDPVEYDDPPPPRFPHDIATVQEGLEKLGRAECLVALDEVMSRRPHNRVLLPYQVRLWRQERLAWGHARDKRADKKEAEE